MPKKIWFNLTDAGKELGLSRRQVETRVEKGQLISNGKSGHAQRVKIISDDTEDSPPDLKEKHLEIKIKKDQQLLYHHQLMLIDKAAEIFKDEFYLPIIVKLTELVRQHSTKELAEKWNQTISDISKERQPILQKALHDQVLG